MALTEIALRKAKAKQRQYKLYDEGGLVLLVRPSGGKLWRLKYRFAGKEQQLSIGRYPDTGLKEARQRREAARKLLSAGIDPAKQKRLVEAENVRSAENTFKVIAEELIAKSEREGRASATLIKARWFLSLLPTSFTNRPIKDIKAPELLAELRKIEIAGHYETTRRVRAFAGRVFRFGIATGRAESDPSAALRGALISPTVTHYAAVLTADGVGALLRAIDGFEGQPITKLALQLAPHVFVRPGELRAAEWSEFDLPKAIWRIPARRTKKRKEHVVPVSKQSLAILQRVQALSGNGALVFPSVRSFHRPLSENTLNAALRRLGYAKDEMTAHGFRSLASTLLNESGKWSADAIERALAHHDSNEVRGTYHRGAHWDERVKMAQWWSDYLDHLRSDTKIAKLRHRRP